MATAKIFPINPSCGLQTASPGDISHIVISLFQYPLFLGKYWLSVKPPDLIFVLTPQKRKNPSFSLSGNAGTETLVAVINCHICGSILLREKLDSVLHGLFTTQLLQPLKLPWITASPTTVWTSRLVPEITSPHFFQLSTSHHEIKALLQ